MSTTRSSIQTTQLPPTCFLATLVVVLLRMLIRILEQERSVNRDLLGVSPGRTETTPPPPMSARSPGPESEPEVDPFEGLPPSITEALMREYAEHTAQYPKNLTIHPDVEQIHPGQTVTTP